MVLIAALAGCKGGGATAPRLEGGVDLRPVDVLPPRDGGSGALAVDFTVSGCPGLDGTPRCTGPAPLTIELVPVSTGAVNKYLWDFGDGTDKVADVTPTHTYRLPGTYEVTLVGGGPAGAVSKSRPGFIVVTANPTGAPCDVDLQCAGGSCVCGSAATCTPAFVRGLCAPPCRGGCGADEVCADFSAAAGAMQPEPWARALCLRGCTVDADCPAELRCRDLPGRNGWVRGCFVEHPLDLGGSCRTAGGVLRHEQCLTGLCADLGANGLCSQDCERGGCPPGSSCAQLNDGRRLCLPRCGPTTTCEGDPLLGCMAPNAGPLGFMVAAGNGGDRYCAPRRCTRNDDCGAIGLCRDDQNGAHCVRRPD